MNPYYDIHEHKLDAKVFEQPNMDWEFNILLFLQHDGKIYTATDSGCSCPTPFEDYNKSSLKETLQCMEEVGSVRQGLQIFDSWKYGIEAERQDLDKWLKLNLGNKQNERKQ